MNKNLLRTLSSGTALAVFSVLGLSVAPSSAATYLMSVTAVTVDNSVDFDTQSDLGDDRGAIALTTSGVIDQGDNGIGLYSPDYATFTESDLTDEDGDAMFTDLGTQQSYFFEWDYAEDATEGHSTFTGFTSINADGSAGSDTVQLSQDLEFYTYDVVEEEDYKWYYAILNGNGHVGIWDMEAGTLWLIEIATGEVTSIDVNSNGDFIDAGALVVPQLVDWSETSTTFGQWGVLEYDGTNYSYVGPAYDVEDEDTAGIYRFPLTETATDTNTALETTLAGEDLWRWVPDCVNGRWYTHMEGYDGNSEAGFAADVDCSFSVEEELADTGFNTSTGIAFAAALLAAGGLAVLRRRKDA